MNRENEEQRPVSQTICGALQKEPNCKCLVLSVLIYGCLAAVTWCRCANVTKIVINFSKYPIKSTKHVSPCDDGYIYIPVAFMGMLYLVYLVECYHSPIRIDLLHAESQDSVLSKLSQLKSAQPTIWWKAVSYHYVRRKRQITRYRNGDNYTTTQVYYERINTHAATSFYYYDYCGVKDISKELVLEPKIPITKIAVTKGFAFSNMRSATEFEEARSRFFAEQELRDDYMEMREGLDLGYNPNPTTLVAVLGNPWFTNRYVYWCLSALLLSWPLRVMIEYKTQYADYQVTKLFGVNYDTPTGSEPIHASISQLTISQPGSYMLAPSYSEALLMDPLPSDQRAVDPQDPNLAEIVPSYSEALLYERAEQAGASNGEARCNDEALSRQLESSSDECSCPCACPCHVAAAASPSLPTFEVTIERVTENSGQVGNDRQSADVSSTVQPTNPAIQYSGPPCAYVAGAETREDGRCGNCGKCSIPSQPEMSDDIPGRRQSDRLEADDSLLRSMRSIRRPRTRRYRAMPRDMSEPNLSSRSESMYTDTRFLRLNGESLWNILENEQEAQYGREERIPSRGCNLEPPMERGQFRFSLSSLNECATPSADRTEIVVDSSRGAIPKRTIAGSRVIANPMSGETCGRLPDSKTYFCLKSILKQNNRRYTLITARELQHFSDRKEMGLEDPTNARSSYHEGCVTSTPVKPDSEGTFDFFSRSRESLDGDVLGRRKRQILEDWCDDKNASAKRESTRTLIFASPIQEVCPGDPFGGKDVVQTRQESNTSPTEETSSQTVLNHLGRSLACDRKASRRRYQDIRKHRYSDNVSYPASFSCSSDRQHPYPYAFSASSDAMDAVVADTNEATARRVYQHAISFPPYDASVSDSNGNGTKGKVDRVSSSRVAQGRTELTRSLTERRSKPTRIEPSFRRSFTGRVDDYRAPEYGKRMNLSMETSL